MDYVIMGNILGIFMNYRLKRSSSLSLSLNGYHVRFLLFGRLDRWINIFRKKYINIMSNILQYITNIHVRRIVTLSNST